MRIAVIGSSVLAWIYAGKLRRAGWEVWLVDLWSEQLALIKRRGLVVCEDQDESILDCKGTDSIEGLPRIDLAIIFSPYQDNPQVAAQLQKVMDQRGWVLSLQRGLVDLECFRDVVVSDHVLRGLTNFEGKRIGPGEVMLTAYGQTLLSAVSGEKAHGVEEILKLFNSSSLNAHYLDKMDDLIWERLIICAAIEPLAAILRVPHGALFKSSYSMALISEVVHEGLKVARQKEVVIKRHDLVNHIMRIMQLTSSQTSSMYQDILDHKITDIDVINGAIVKQGEHCQVSTPINAMLTALIHSIEECTIN